MKKKPAITTLLICAGLVLMLSGGWIKAKAALAQILLNQAFEESLETGHPIKPWPWADTWPIARLSVPHLAMSYIVLEGDTGSSLAFGPGHVASSARPGQTGNCVIAGHRDTSFSFLQHLTAGDILTLQTKEGTTSYKVQSTAVEKADNLYLQQPDTPWLTLITCFPFESLTSGTPFRFVVFASQVSG